MSATASMAGSGSRFTADAALKGAARLWFLVALAGQWFFMVYIVAFYGPSTASGHFEAWTRNKFLNMSYVPGDTAGNLFFASHALFAAVVAFAGALQLVPQIRARAIGFHRWNGRIFLFVSLGNAVSGLYLVLVRGDRFGAISAASLVLNAALIIVCAALAWRMAMARDIPAHRRWALRTYMAANAQWFTRVGVYAWYIATGGVGMTDSFDGPANYVAMFGCYLIPLGVLELYLRAREQGSPAARVAVAGALVASVLIMSLGRFAYSMGSLKLLGWA